MEQNLPVVGKRIWETVPVIFFMLRKRISKRKLILDLNLMLKRDNKIATKAKSIRNLMFQFYHHHDNLASFLPPAADPGIDMIVEASPMPMMLPGFGRSPMVRQLRITDSSFPLRDEGDNGVVDKKADEFIEKFCKELRKQMSG
ncbi:uncharacterized protein [Euphorbia lathyris]|uniref:uncharacterized protein n=1 Tax=Euphorbia lathyris TaxID=212925 RepID=UPI0033132247